MVNHCANPACKKQLHYLRDGKVFLFSAKKSSENSSKLPNRLEHYWLCGKCAKQWTLSMDGNAEVKLVETRKKRARSDFAAPSASPAA
jgi:hypothetical protein